MRPLPSSKYRLPQDKEPLYEALKQQEESIFDAYSSLPFDPAHPEYTCIRAFFDLYSCADPEVLYLRLIKLSNPVLFNILYNNAFIGLLSGLISGILVYLIDFFSGISQFWLGLILLAVFSTLIFLLFVFLIRILLPTLTEKPLTEKRIDMMYQILNLDKYFYPQA